MTTSERIDAIRNKKVEMDNTEQARKEKMKRHNEWLKHEVQALVEMYGNDLIRVANELQDIGFNLLTEEERSIGRDASLFITNGIRHQVGFYTTTPKFFYDGRHNIIGFGIENGGACGNVDLVIDVDGNVIKRGEVYSTGKMPDLERFYKEFVQFKDDFYTYVDKWLNKHC